MHTHGSGAVTCTPQKIPCENTR